MNVNDEYITHMGFTDDMVIIAETAEDLSAMLDDLSTVSNKVSHKMNMVFFRVIR